MVCRKLIQNAHAHAFNLSIVLSCRLHPLVGLADNDSTDQIWR
jgi:hypothetical protein